MKVLNTILRVAVIAVLLTATMFGTHSFAPTSARVIADATTSFRGFVPESPALAERPGDNITDLGTLGGDFSDAFGINNVSSDPASMQVVGRSTNTSGFLRAFVWTAAGGMIDLGALAGNSAAAYRINNHDQVAGYSQDASGQNRAVLWTRTVSGWSIEDLGALPGATSALALGMNNGNTGDPAAISVAGTSGGRAVLWTKNEAGWTIQELGTLPGDTSSTARDVNDAGTAVGSSQNSTSGVTRAYLWTAANGMLELADAGGGETYALRINNAGDVAGFSRGVSGNRHAVLWRAATNWALEDLGTLGGCCSEGLGINSSAEVVGVSNVGRRSTGLQHGFLASAGARMTDLGALHGTSVARDVNDFGFVVGGGDARRGSLHAFLWTLP